jgi:hypothetical protein
VGSNKSNASPYSSSLDAEARALLLLLVPACKCLLLLCLDLPDWLPGLLSPPAGSNPPRLSVELLPLVFLPPLREGERVYSHRSWLAMQRSQPLLSPLHLS